MNAHETHETASPVSREQSKQLIQRWSFLLEQGRSELHLKQWFIASGYYQQALLVAESLFAASLCRNCALRCYMRTFMEFAYITSRIHGPESLELLEQTGTLILSRYLPMESVDKLLQPINSFKHQTDQERELWINQLFVSDAVCRRQVH